MSRPERFVARSLPLVMLAVSVLLTSCAPVGSGRWCANMQAKPKGDWTPNEAVDFAKHCVLPDTDKKG